MSENYVIVTGGARNIGAAISLRLKQDGYSPLILDNAEPENKSIGEYFPVDLSDMEASKQILDELTSRYKITRLVNNVGIVKPASIEESSIDDFELVMNLNVRTTLLCTQALLPEMKRANFGRIVCNASRVVLGKELRTNYSASKGAIQSMSRTWALELARYGITVNCVAPGPIGTTAFWENNPPESKKVEQLISNIPVQKMGKPEDVANAVSFFTDNRSCFVTGQTLYVCGGVTVGQCHS